MLVFWMLFCPVVFAGDALVSPSGYRLIFADLPSPYTGDVERLASQLETPSGARVRGDIQESLYGQEHWFRWESHRSWPYDALRQWTGGASCCMWYWFVPRGITGTRG